MLCVVEEKENICWPFHHQVLSPSICQCREWGRGEEMSMRSIKKKQLGEEGEKELGEKNYELYAEWGFWGLEEALAHPCLPQLRETRVPMKEGRGCSAKLSPAPSCHI